MTQNTNGGPAFPVLHSIDGHWTREPLDRYAGMSLRDWFAGQALVGLSIGAFPTWRGADVFAERAYSVADAMLAERAKQEGA